MQATQTEAVHLRANPPVRGSAAGRDETATISPFKYWRFCAAMGPVFLAVFIVCWGVLGYNIPPLSAEWTGEQMATHFRTHANEVRAGMAGSMTFAVLYMGQALKWDYLWAALCMMGAVYFIFRS